LDGSPPTASGELFDHQRRRLISIETTMQTNSPALVVEDAS
jgi:hypothetical protein